MIRCHRVEKSFDFYSDKRGMEKGKKNAVGSIFDLVRVAVFLLFGVES